MVIVLFNFEDIVVVVQVTYAFTKFIVQTTSVLKFSNFKCKQLGKASN